MSADDQQLWNDYAAKVKRAARKKSQPALTPPGIKAVGGRGNKIIPQPPAPPPAQAKRQSLATPALFDRRTERALRAGDVTLDGRLDLHGMTQGRAHAALDNFIARHLAAGSRKLLVITGQGRGGGKEGQGVLKASLPGWLEALPHAGYIIDLRPAALKHGGAGAWYVWLKKQG